MMMLIFQQNGVASLTSKRLHEHPHLPSDVLLLGLSPMQDLAYSREQSERMVPLTVFVAHPVHTGEADASHAGCGSTACRPSW